MEDTNLELVEENIEDAVLVDPRRKRLITTAAIIAGAVVGIAVLAKFASDVEVDSGSGDEDED